MTTHETASAEGPTPRAAGEPGQDARRDEAGVKRLDSVREGRLLAGPETLQLNLQNACQARCIFCWNHSPLLPAHPPAWQRERLGDAHLDDVLASLERLRPSRVLLSGRGEPLLHPRVEQLLHQTRALGIPTSVQTNGLGGPAPRRLAELGVAQLLVNVSAGTAEGYDRCHPGQGAGFDRIVERLTKLAAIRRRAGAPRVSLVAVIQRTNADEIGAMAELAARLEAESLQLRGMEMMAGLEPLALEGAERERALAAVDAVRARADHLGLTLDDSHLSWVLGGADRQGHFSEQLARGPCYMGWYYLRVTCDGRVMFCCKDKQVDHLDRRSLYAIWRSAGYQLLRLGGRDGDTSVGLFDAKCRTCSNVVQNEQVRRALRDTRLSRAR